MKWIDKVAEGFHKTAIYTNAVFLNMQSVTKKR